MSHLRLDDYTNSYRTAHSDELDAPAILRRIQGTLSQRDQRRSRNRWVTWLGSMGITTALGASLAYAAPYGRSWLDWVNEVTTSLPPKNEGQPGSMGAPAAPPSIEAAESPSSSHPPPAVDDNAVTGEGAVSLQPSARSQPSRPSSPKRPRSTDIRSTALPRDPLLGGAHSAGTSVLYGEAQRLQFVERDFVAALLAWEHYLEITSDAVLRPGAEYNRVVCLVHLRRYHEARVELKRLTGPFASPAYRSRAATLLHSLEKIQR